MNSKNRTCHHQADLVLGLGIIHKAGRLCSIETRRGVKRPVVNGGDIMLLLSDYVLINCSAKMSALWRM